jgi:hypothetical protein
VVFTGGACRAFADLAADVVDNDGGVTALVRVDPSTNMVLSPFGG